jgi:3-phenylpropionate/cinnamic acid dioxygenase small subunit
MSAIAEPTPSATDNLNGANPVNHDVNYTLLKEVEQFLYREARLADERQYREWENLWTDDAIYWVPANSADIDPEREMSIIYDNRSRIALRVNQFYTGKRYMAESESALRRLVSNVELLAENGDEVTVASNFVIFESTRRHDNVWGGRTEHRLRKVEGQWQMAYKKVALVNCDKALDNITFMI